MNQPEDEVLAHKNKTLRTLPWITILNYWIGFAFFVSHGVIDDNPLPVLGLIPMTASLILAGYRLWKFGKQVYDYQILIGDDGNEGPKKAPREASLALLGLVILSFDLVVYVLTTIFTFARHRCHDQQALAAYATVTLLVDMGIHGYFFAHAVQNGAFKYKKHDCAVSCPNCRARKVTAETSELRPRDGEESAVQV